MNSLFTPDHLNLLYTITLPLIDVCKDYQELMIHLKIDQLNLNQMNDAAQR